MSDLHLMAQDAREAAWQLAACDIEIRNRFLSSTAGLLEEQKQRIFEANREDLAEASAEGLAVPLYERLKFGEEKLAQSIAGLRALENLPDPIRNTTLSRELMPGLELYRVTCPIGVIGVIFESRPDALIQISSLAIKSGNAVLLKGGREALRTNRVLCEVLRQAAVSAGIDAACVQLLESREEVSAMLKEDSLIDLIIPRGSKSFVRYILDNSRIPVLGHADGLCHVYVDQYADKAKALKVALDSKIQNVSVCNAAETLLIHSAAAETILPELLPLYTENGVRILGDKTVCERFGCEPATEEDWDTEYLDRILSVKVVRSLREAIDHINRHGSHHTDCIITEDKSAASRFLSEVDSAGVYVNVSTRFADGFVYGFGAEVGIATGKLHARGPMGLEGLVTYKYKLIGSGQTMKDVKNGTLTYTHQTIAKDCPL